MTTNREVPMEENNMLRRPLINWDKDKKKLFIFMSSSDLETNPSWEGVKSMDREEIENKYNIILSREEIPVRYVDVDRIVPHLWDTCRPDLTIHVGVSETVSNFVLETRANKSSYLYPDIDEQCPANYENVCDGPDCIDTRLDVKAICDEFNGDPPGDDLQAEISSVAGLYLCEYIYYTSLCRGTTLFVHVPLDTYTSEQLAQGLERILELCLRQLPNADTYSCNNNKVKAEIDQVDLDPDLTAVIEPIVETLGRWIARIDVRRFLSQEP